MSRRRSALLWALLLLSFPALSHAVGPEATLVPQVPHAGNVTALAELPQLGLLATGGSDGTVRLWSTTTGQAVHVLRPRQDEQSITALAASRAKPWLAIAVDARDSESEAVVEIWDFDLNASNRLRSFPGHPTGVGIALAFSPDDALLAAANGRALTLWEIATGQRLVTLTSAATVVTFLDANRIVYQSEKDAVVLNVRTGAHETLGTGPGKTLAVSPDGTVLAHCAKAEGSKVAVWDLATRSRLGGADLLGECRKLAFSSDSRTLLIGAWRNQVYRLRAPDWSQLWGFLECPSLFNAMTILSDDRVAVSPDTTGVVEIRDLDTAAELLRLGAPRPLTTALAFSDDPHLFASGDFDGAVRIWDLSTGEVAFFDARREPRHPILALAFSPGSRLLASGGRDGWVTLRDLTTGRSWSVQFLGPDSLAFHGEQLLAASGLRSVKIWNLTGAGLDEGVLLEAPDNVDRVAFSDDGKWLAVSGVRSLWIYDREAGRWLLRRDDLGSSYASNATVLRFMGDRTLLRVVDRTVETWDLKEIPDARVSRQYLPYTWTSAMAFDPISQTLLMGGGTGNVWSTRLVDFSVRQIAAHDGRVSSAAVSPSGRFLASGGSEIKLWSLPDLRLLATVQPLAGNAWLAFSPEGFFDGTQEAWSQVPFQIRSEPLRSFQAEQFFNLFYQPDLLPDLIDQGGSIREHLRRRQDPRADLGVASFLDSRPPRVRILSPLPTSSVRPVSGEPDVWSGTGTDWKIPALRPLLESVQGPPMASREIDLVIEVTDTGSGARDCRVYRNRVRVPRAPRMNGSTQVSVPVKLVAGRNELSVYCFNDDGLRSSSDSVTVQGAGSLARPARAWVLTFGVNDYATDQLRYAAADSRLFAQELGRSLSAMQDQRVVALSLEDAEATRETLLSALASLSGEGSYHAGLPEKLRALEPTQPEDIVVFFFAGHGIEKDGIYYLFPSGSTPGDPSAGGAVSDRDLEAAFTGIDAGQFLLALDTCHSGSVTYPADDTRLGPLNSRGLAQLAYEKGMFVISAAQRNREAWELPDLKQGLLTHALIKDGLMQWAADIQPADGFLSAREWLDYAVCRVPELMVQTLGLAYARGGLDDPRLISAFAGGARGTRKIVDAAALQQPKAFIRRGISDLLLSAVRGPKPPIANSSCGSVRGAVARTGSL